MGDETLVCLAKEFLITRLNILNDDKTQFLALKALFHGHERNMIGWEELWGLIITMKTFRQTEEVLRVISSLKNSHPQINWEELREIINSDHPIHAFEPIERPSSPHNQEK